MALRMINPAMLSIPQRRLCLACTLVLGILAMVAAHLDARRAERARHQAVAAAAMVMLTPAMMMGDALGLQQSMRALVAEGDIEGLALDYGAGARLQMPEGAQHLRYSAWPFDHNGRHLGTLHLALRRQPAYGHWIVQGLLAALLAAIATLGLAAELPAATGGGGGGRDGRQQNLLVVMRLPEHLPDAGLARYDRLLRRQMGAYGGTWMGGGDGCGIIGFAAGDMDMAFCFAAGVARVLPEWLGAEPGCAVLCAAAVPDDSLVFAARCQYMRQMVEMARNQSGVLLACGDPQMLTHRAQFERHGQMHRAVQMDARLLKMWHNQLSNQT